MPVRIESSRHQVFVEILEAFDASDAFAVHEAIAAAPGATVAIDFRGARRCDPVAVALLSQEILARPGRIELSGICRQELRLLEYFGVAAAAQAQA